LQLIATMSQPVDAKYQSKELNLYSNDGKNKYSFTDATGLVQGLAPTTPILKLESDVSADGMQGSIAIPNLLYKLHASDYYSFLSYAIYALESKDAELTAGLAQELVDRKNADDVLTSGLATEVKARGDADSVHTGAIAQEVYDRGAGDLANSQAITTEIADRKAAVLVVSNAAASNALAITAEAKARADADVVLTTAVSDEKTRAELAEYGLNNDIQGEIGHRMAAVSTVSAAVVAEAKRATDKEALLDARIDFITHNTDATAIDSLSEIVAQFSVNGQGYADRLTYLEGVIAALVAQ
jgi:hypothetical protein